MIRKYYLIGTLLTVAAVLAILLAYPHLPNQVPTHWNVEGQANGYSTKWTLFLFGPGFMAGTMLLFYFLPWLSPKHWQVDTFQSTYLYIMMVLVSLLAYFTGVSLWAALGQAANVDRAIVGGICLLFALLGNVMGKVRRNFFIGVRTPWALANERVWNATHRFAAKTFVLGGVIGLALTAFGVNGWPPFAALMAGALVPVVYSLVVYKQLERRGEL
ncbi:MAG TPA: SdpI family protein [Terriglobales bacterium]|jgi:uncharacterized membrane protein|nr:SdpI family protein [Terriglobales bacterium]